MNSIPVMDSRNIDRDSNGVVTIKSMPILAYVVAATVLLFSLVSLSRGEFIMGIIVMAAGAFILFRASVFAVAFEFNPITRTFTMIAMGTKATFSFDEIAGFGTSTETATGDFTKENILVLLKDNNVAALGLITDANEKMRKEKVTNMLKFLYETTGIVLSMSDDNRLEVENSRKESPELISSDQPVEESSDSSARTNSLEKFIIQINQLTLNESAEEYYKRGEALMAKNEFDDAILEYVKAIRVSSPQEKWYMSAKKGLKGMGFSESDIQQV